MMRIEAGKSPLYLRLADAIRADILSGALSPGDQLPTVREMAEEKGLSAGTVRHAYDYLAREGELVMRQGKGSFVPGEGAPGGREARAMAAIDGMIDTLTALGFSVREMEMYLSVKLKELSGVETLPPVAVVDCNPESLTEVVGQLSAVAPVELSEFLLEDIRRAPKELLSAFPLILTTVTHYHELISLIEEQPARVARMVLSASPLTVAAIARVEPGGGVGIYCRTRRFSEIVRGGMRIFPHLRLAKTPCLLSGEGGSLPDFLRDLRYLLVAPDYLSYASPEDQAALNAFAEDGGLVIPYHHQIDQGSMLYISERIQTLLKRANG